jgi:hypothetical protein
MSSLPQRLHDELRDSFTLLMGLLHVASYFMQLFPINLTEVSILLKAFTSFMI